MANTWFRRFFVLLPAIFVAACVGAPPPAACPPNLGQPMLEATLYFGRTVKDRPDVTETEWAEFVARVVAPALPDGFTVFDARGAWLNPRTLRTVHEATKVLLVALPDRPDASARLDQVRHAYQIQFNQQLVGMTAHPTCASF